MNRFAFILHPLGFDDFYRKFEWMKKLPEGMLKKATKHAPPFKISNIEGIKSKTGKEIKGFFYACPLTTEQIMSLDQNYVIDKIIKSVKKAEDSKVQIVGLGSFTSVVGDKGISIAKKSNVAITTGNSYTIATAVEGTKLAAQKMGTSLKDEGICIIGANGSIGKTISRIIAKDVDNIILVSRNMKKLKNLKNIILEENININVEVTDNIEQALDRSKIIITVSGAVESIIDPAQIKSGSVICDVARPRDVAIEVGNKRNDVLVIEGGIVHIPGDVNFNFNFGVTGQNAYACMAETMLLTLEDKFTNYSLGPDIEIKKVKETTKMAQKHGFKLAGLRSFGKLLSEEDIKSIRMNSN
ncbi:MAG: shikimate dehydrogenase [Halanaerobiales bacterium]|nr:shikimate dehydrogenase [Halanaerobiales bacterium]